MKFTHLHVHSHYSLLDGLPKIDELLDYVKALGMDAVALTDHGALYGAIEFFRKAQERGIKPIIGAELYVALEGMDQRRPNIDDKRYHLVLLVKNDEGYKNLVQLITKAHLEGFYYKPRIDEDFLSKHTKGLIALSACLQGKIPRLILSNKITEAENLSLKYQKIFGKDNFFLEIQHHPNIDEQKKVNQQLINISKKYEIPLVATNDVHYLKKEDAEAQDILMLINTGANLNDPERLTLKADDFSMGSPEQMAEYFKDSPEAIENTQKIAALCNFQFELGKIKLPYFPVEEGKTADGYLKELCMEGLKKRHQNAEMQGEVMNRLNYELSVIQKTGFASYFLIVQDFVNWAKQNRIVVGPGRGSVGGSLVAYLLNITSVDPLKYKLLFERFLTNERISLPDIDLDFTDRRRNEVINYVSQKYGSDNVAQIITFGTMAARAVIRDVGRASGYAYSYCDQIAKMIPFGFTLEDTLRRVSEFREMYETDNQAKKLIDLAKKLEGVARHASTHACGVVISPEPLSNYVPLQHPTQDDETIVTQYEMHSIENLGLLKMDLLGLKNLTIIEDTLSRVYVIHNKTIDIENIPPDDKKTYKLLQRGDTVGVFQLESPGMQRYLKQLKPTGLEDIIAMAALYRPGPMALIPEYMKGKSRKKQIEYIHPALKPVLENTYGVMVYQEQLMEVVHKLAGFSLTEADILRKAIGKKIPSLLFAQKEKFIEGMKRNNIDEQVGQRIWNWILPFARYGFNRAHATCYATIAYQTAYLKANFPVEFMAALLTSEKADVERIGFLMRECKKMGIEILPPDINESLANFTVVPDQNQIRFGLTAIKNVGQNIVKTIVQERKENGPYQSITEFITRANAKDLNKKSLESLTKAGVFDKMAERNQLLFNLERLLEWSREIQRIKNNHQRALFSEADMNRQFQLLPAAPASKNEKLNWEKELLGLFITSHPLEGFKKIFDKVLPISKITTEISDRTAITPSGGNSAGGDPSPFVVKGEGSSEARYKRFQQIKIGGVISGIKKVLTRIGKPMLFLSLEDQTDKIEVIVFPAVIERNPAIFQENKIVLVSGRVDSRDGVPKLICDEIEEIINTD